MLHDFGHVIRGSFRRHGKAAKDATLEQIEARKEKASRFLRDVLDDPERAAEVEAESVEDYATRRGLTLKNRAPAMKWADRLANLRKEENPVAPREKVEDVLSDRDALIDTLEDVRDQIDDALAEYEEEGEEPEEGNGDGED